MNDSQNIKFRLVSIVNERTTTNPEKVGSTPISEESLQFQYKVGTTIQLAENTITVVPGIRYMVDGSVLFESSADFIYSIPSLEEVINLDRENKKLNLKVNIFPTLLSAAYNSLRGIVYTRTLNTPLESYPLPMIEVNTLLSRNGISVLD